jgi:hypothetical protein
MSSNRLPREVGYLLGMTSCIVFGHAWSGHAQEQVHRHPRKLTASAEAPTTETCEAHVLEVGQGVAQHIVPVQESEGDFVGWKQQHPSKQSLACSLSPVQVVEEAREPAHHQLVVAPAGVQLLEQGLIAVITKRRQHLQA